MIDIHPTNKTPGIKFLENRIEIFGKSIPEDSLTLYAKIKSDIFYFIKDKDNVEIDFKLIYFNTSSYKSILETIREIKKQNINFVINWFYDVDDEDMLDAGKDIMELLDVKMNFFEQVEED